MKLVKGMMAVVALSAFTTNAVAEETDAKVEAKAPIHSILPNAYGSVTTEYYTKYEMNKAANEVSNEIPAFYLYPALGSTFFDGKVNSVLTWGFAKKSGTNAISREYMETYTTLSLWSNDFAYVTPALLGYQKDGANFNSLEVRVSVGLKHDMELAAGKLSFNGKVQPKTTFVSNTNRETIKGENIRNETALEGAALTKAVGEDVKQKDPTLGLRNEYSVSFAPAALEGLGLMAGIRNENTYTPKYKFVAVGEEVRTDQDGYETSVSTRNVVGITYAINDMWSVYNYTYTYTEGLYEARKDGNRVLNTAGFTATLF